MDKGFEYSGNELEVFAHASNWKAYCSEAMAPFVGGDVLEVGAGLGATCAALAGLPRRSWTCLEPDATLAARLKQSLGEHTPRVVVGTLYDLPQSERFDSILYVDVLEHIDDDRGQLRAAALRLNPGGRLVVLAPAHRFLYSAFDRAVGHHRRYDRASLARLTPEETTQVMSRYLDSVGMLASAANRFLLRSGRPGHAQIRFWDRTMVPLSRLLDRRLGYRLGKSILAVWQTSPD